MATYEDAKQLAKTHPDHVTVHWRPIPYSHSDAPGQLRWKLVLAVTWCPPPVIFVTGNEDIPSSQMMTITQEQAAELLALGVQDERSATP
jgi:hypothetical protein